MSNSWMYVPDITTAGICDKPEHKIEAVPVEHTLEEELRDRVIISMGLDPKLAEQIADVVERKVTDEMKANVYDLIMKKTSYYNPRYSDAKKYNLQDWVVEEIKNVILENKEEIIQAAAEKLADSMRRSKPVRERFCDIFEEELEVSKGWQVMSNEEILARIGQDVTDFYGAMFSERNITIWMTKGLFNRLFPGEFILQKEDIATITLFGCNIKVVIFPYAGEQWIIGYEGAAKEE